MGWEIKKKRDDFVVCSLVNQPVVYLEPTPRQKIELLMGAYPHQEWLAYLVGSVSEKGNIFIEDISVPPHASVSGASAEAEPFYQPEKCVGIIHSHHSMGAFHSGVDRDYVDGAYPTSITVANKGGVIEYDAVTCAKTPCGKMSQGKATVKYVAPKPLFDTETWLKEAKENIDKGKKVYTPMQESYVPMRFRLHGGEDGNLLSEKEAEKVYAKYPELRPDKERLSSQDLKRISQGMDKRG